MSTIAMASEDVRRGALQRLYEEHRGDVFAFLLALVRDRALAEDVLSETFVRAYAHVNDVEPAKVRGWVFMVARNAALDALRRERKEKDPPRVERPSTLPLAELARGEQIARARTALAALPDEARALLLQRHGLDMKLAEIAESSSCTERTVRNRLRAAAEQFARALLGRPSKEGEA